MSSDHAVSGGVQPSRVVGLVPNCPEFGAKRNLDSFGRNAGQAGTHIDEFDLEETDSAV